MKQQKYSLMVLCAAVCALFAPAAFAGVTFTNLNGAVASWVWMEAENFSSANGFAKTYSNAAPSTDGRPYSGWQDIGKSNVAYSTNPSAGSGTYVVTVPAAMTATYLYAHSSGNYPDTGRTMDIYAGSTKVGSYTNLYGWNWDASGNLGEFASGDTSLKLQIAVYCDPRIDGFFLASQAINEPTTAQRGEWWWMQAPTFTGTLPTLSGSAFTPMVGGAPTDATYWANGVEQANGFSAITASGAYNLVIKDSLGDVLAGTSFNYEVVPEPASLGLLALGGLVLVRRWRRE